MLSTLQLKLNSQFRYRAAIRYKAEKDLSHRLENQVPLGVAVAVVYVLEIVHIQHYPHYLRPVFRLLDYQIHVMDEIVAVIEPGQRVQIPKPFRWRWFLRVPLQVSCERRPAPSLSSSATSNRTGEFGARRSSFHGIASVAT